MIRPSRPPGSGLEGYEIKAISYGIVVFGLSTAVLLMVGGLGGLKAWTVLLVIVFVNAPLGAAVGFLSMYAAERAGDAAKLIYMPSGKTTPYQDSFSPELAMAMRGQVPAALASFEARIAGAPDNPIVRLAAADMYATKGKDPARAAELYRQARALPAATRAHEMAATNALIDLYRGALADRPRMMTELRRLADRFAGTPPGELALRTLMEMKAELSERPE